MEDLVEQWYFFDARIRIRGPKSQELKFQVEILYYINSDRVNFTADT